MRIIKRSGEEQEFNPQKSVLPLEKPTTAYLKQNSFRRITYLPILHRLWLHVKTSVTRPPCRKYRTLWKMS